MNKEIKWKEVDAELISLCSLRAKAALTDLSVAPEGSYVMFAIIKGRAYDAHEDFAILNQTDSYVKVLA